jgi:UDP-N-acetylglucosamine acyltransferase
LNIHPTAIVSDGAEVSAQATVGPYSVIAGKVRIGAHTVIESHVRIGGDFGEVCIGPHNYIQSGATLGGPPQDWSYQGAQTKLEIGDHNRIGEGASVNLGSAKGGGVTRIGNDTFIMASSHVGHDCQIGNGVVLTNLVQLAGHVVVEDKCIVSGLAAATQFVRLGRLSFVAAGAIANKDILPYAMAEGHWAVPRATNKVGLKRAGFSAAEIREVDQALRLLLDRALPVSEALSRISAWASKSPAIEHLLEFVTASERGIARP